MQFQEPFLPVSARGARVATLAARIALLLAMTVVMLCAESITFTTATPTFPVPGTGAVSLIIPQFDQAFGLTLNSAVFTLTVTTSVTAVGTNSLGIEANYGFHSDTEVSLPTLNQQFPLGFYIYAPSGGSFNAAPGPFSFTSLAKTAMKSTTLGRPFLAPYIGSGTVNLPIFLNEFGPDGLAMGPHLQGPNGRIPGPTSNWSAQLAVQYNYSVPEPATGWMIGAALVLLGLGRGSQKEG